MNETEQELWCAVYASAVVYLLDANGVTNALQHTRQARQIANEAVSGFRRSERLFAAEDSK